MSIALMSRDSMYSVQRPTGDMIKSHHHRSTSSSPTSSLFMWATEYVVSDRKSLWFTATWPGCRIVWEVTDRLHKSRVTSVTSATLATSYPLQLSQWDMTGESSVEDPVSGQLIREGWSWRQENIQDVSWRIHEQSQSCLCYKQRRKWKRLKDLLCNDYNFVCVRNLSPFTLSFQVDMLLDNKLWREGLVKT